MTLYRYELTCGHQKMTPDKREVGITVKCNSCAARGWDPWQAIKGVSVKPIGDEEDTRG